MNDLSGTAIARQSMVGVFSVIAWLPYFPAPSTRVRGVRCPCIAFLGEPAELFDPRLVPWIALPWLCLRVVCPVRFPEDAYFVPYS